MKSPKDLTRFITVNLALNNGNAKTMIQSPQLFQRKMSNVTMEKDYAILIWDITLTCWASKISLQSPGLVRFGFMQYF